MHGKAPNGWRASKSWIATAPASGRRTATTCTAIPGARSATADLVSNSAAAFLVRLAAPARAVIVGVDFRWLTWGRRRVLAAGKEFFDVGDIFRLVRFHARDHLPAMIVTKDRKSVV